MAKIKTTLNYQVNKDFLKFYDELINIDLDRQPSDIGFVDNDKMMIRPRKPLSFTFALPSVTGNASNVFYMTDRA